MTVTLTKCHSRNVSTKKIAKRIARILTVFPLIEAPDFY